MSLYTHNIKRHSLALYALFSLIITLIGCKSGLDTFYPVNQSINEPLASDPNKDYRIVSVTFAGVPFESVRIDHQKRLVTVDLPANLPSGDLKPIFELTKGTALLSGLGMPFLTENLCACNYNRTVSIGPWGASTNSGNVNYTFSFLTTAPLTINPLTAPLDIQLTQQMSITLSATNIFANDPLVRAYAQRNDGSAPVLLLGQEGNTNGCYLFSCSNQQPGYLFVNFYLSYANTLLPGTYSVYFEQKSGRRLPLSQPVRFFRGPPKLSVFGYYGYSVTRGTQGFNVSGENLFADELTGKLTDLNGQTWSLKPTYTSPYGGYITMDVPTDLKPGYYALQLFSSNAQIGNCLRFSVQLTGNHPQIYSMNGQAICLAQAPVTLRRSVPQTIIVSQYTLPKLRLVSLEDPTRIYSVPVVIPKQGFPQITLPETVVVGSYKASIVTEVYNQTLESEPFEQPVIVQ